MAEKCKGGLSKYCGFILVVNSLNQGGVSFSIDKIYKGRKKPTEEEISSSRLAKNPHSPSSLHPWALCSPGMWKKGGFLSCLPFFVFLFLTLSSLFLSSKSSNTCMEDRSRRQVPRQCCTKRNFTSFTHCQKPSSVQSRGHLPGCGRRTQWFFLWFLRLGSS